MGTKHTKTRGGNAGTWSQEYAPRDIVELDRQGGYYARHVMAMTVEGLHDKSDIAAELAVRDMLIDGLAAEVRRLLEALGR